MVDNVILEAVRLTRVTSSLSRWRARDKGAATFQRLGDASVERRREPRRNARLAWGKALDGADRFLCECLVADRAKDGARLKLARNISLPARFQFFEDDSGVIYEAHVVWRRGLEIGCRFSRSLAQDKAAVMRRMKSRYYAL